jgi:lipopolysaccharide transport system ATP-binding protein
VGTGFHPDLTGRENVFLNGAILGMTKKEIQSKFDEIVDFAGVERYIDTPVKRYSSGMYVRLAFAVAAFLEPEILIVDEVLAVGDAEFQKKCLGRMQDMSKNDGRTVLFVSHNLSAVQNLCSEAMLLINGQLHSFGLTEQILDEYLKTSMAKNSTTAQRVGNNKINYTNYELQNYKGEIVSEFFMGDSIFCEISIKFNDSVKNAEVGINIKNIFGEIFTHVTSLDNNVTISGKDFDTQKFRVELKGINFTPGLYKIDIGLAKGTELFDFIEEAMSFQITQGKNIIRPGNFPSHVKTFINSSWDKIN